MNFPKHTALDTQNLLLQLQLLQEHPQIHRNPTSLQPNPVQSRIMATTNGITPTTAPTQVLHKYQAYIDNHLPTVNEVDKLKETECPICYMNWLQGDTIVQTKCGHQFHIACLILWFETAVGEYMNNTCPSCRAPLYRKISVRSRRRELEVSHSEQRLRDALETRARLEQGMREAIQTREALIRGIFARAPPETRAQVEQELQQHLITLRRSLRRSMDTHGDVGNS
jgi:hypothetical protein